MEYVYRGDRLTDLEFKNKLCCAIRKNGKCIRGKNGNMLVQFENGVVVNIPGRQLRKIKKL
jgi:hypothetical protein